MEGRPEGQAKVDMEQGTEEGGGQVEVPGTEDQVMLCILGSKSTLTVSFPFISA